MHRELSHITTLAAPLELKGRTVRKTGQEPKSSLGKWENLVTFSSGPPMSPRSVKNRCQESNHAKRTLQPELNNDAHQNKTRKIAEKEGGPDAGSLLRLFRKSGTVEEVHSSKKKYFKDHAQTQDMVTPKPEKKMYRPHSRKQDDLRTHISTLASPINTYQPDKAEISPMTPSSPTKQKRQDFLKSAIHVLPCGDDTKRPFQDRDEAYTIQSASSPKLMRHLSSTYLHEPLHPTTNKRNPNHQNYESYENQGRLNPMTKGKKGAPPKLEIDSNIAFRPHGAPSSPRYGHTEPLDPMFLGQRHVVPRTPTSTILSPSSEQTVPRGQTVFSYRTFASQIF